MGGKSGAQMREALRNFINATVGVSVLQGEVKSVDESRWTCDVELPNTLLLYDVQLKCLKETEKGCVLVPKVGSWVQIMNVGEPDWLVIAIEQLDKVIVLAETELQIDAAGSTVQVNKDGIVMNGGKNEGLVIVQKLVDKINRLEKKVDDLIGKHNGLQQDYNSHTHLYIPGPGTATTPSAIPSALSSNTETPIGVQTKKTDIENPKVKH